MPPSLTAVTWMCVADPGSTCTANGTGDVDDITVTLAVNESITYTVVATIDVAATGNIINTATVTAVDDPQSLERLVHGHRHPCPSGPRDNQGRRHRNGGARRLGDLHDHRIQRGPDDALGGTVADTFPGLTSSSAHPRRQRHLHRRRQRQHQRHRQPARPASGDLHRDAPPSRPPRPARSQHRHRRYAGGVTDPTPGEQQRDRHRHADPAGGSRRSPRPTA